MYYGAVRHFELKWEKFYAGQIIRSLAGRTQSAYGVNDNKRVLANSVELVMVYAQNVMDKEIRPVPRFMELALFLS